MKTTAPGYGCEEQPVVCFRPDPVDADEQKEYIETVKHKAAQHTCPTKAQDLAAKRRRMTSKDRHTVSCMRSMCLSAFDVRTGGAGDSTAALFMSLSDLDGVFRICEEEVSQTPHPLDPLLLTVTCTRLADKMCDSTKRMGRVDLGFGRDPVYMTERNSQALAIYTCMLERIKGRKLFESESGKAQGLIEDKTHHGPESKLLKGLDWHAGKHPTVHTWMQALRPFISCQDEHTLRKMPDDLDEYSKRVAIAQAMMNPPLQYDAAVLAVVSLICGASVVVSEQPGSECSHDVMDEGVKGLAAGLAALCEVDTKEILTCRDETLQRIDFHVLTEELQPDKAMHGYQKMIQAAVKNDTLKQQRQRQHQHQHKHKRQRTAGGGFDSGFHRTVMQSPRRGLLPQSTPNFARPQHLRHKVMHHPLRFNVTSAGIHMAGGMSLHM